ncbi:phytanoyl-CoA dioxygenase family protein [Negadavirga shengliensis]|uniref:Phytanoyl-CoA dioxygenase family protein n=1 Tax=Negadavirga shengliensis TaxID=1389218 RepID=A0ABV9SXB5_9BACT
MENRFNEKNEKEYMQDGYTIVKGMFDAGEMEAVLDTALEDEVIRRHTYGRKDKEGHTTKLALWYALGRDVYSNIARSERYLEGVEKLLGGAPAHFHTKLMQKEPKVGGAWEWHQDYGYWYHDGFLYPQMLSVMLALTQADKKNGCLQVLRGSHLLGRIDHGMTGDQKGADMEKVTEALKRLELVHVELQPGDVLFFHCNLLHRSDKNNSEKARWSLISTYNLISNKPYKQQDPSCYTPIEERYQGRVRKDDTARISEKDAHFLH